MQRKSLGHCIRDLRKSKGITATFVAEKIGISSSSLWKIEHDSMRVRADHLEQLAGVLGVDVSYFFACSVDKNANEGASYETTV